MLVTENVPPLASLIVPPVILTPLCVIVLPAALPIVNVPPPELVTLELSSSVPPLSAESVPVFVIAVAAALLGVSVIVPPLTSAAIVPLLTICVAPPTYTEVPTLPVPP